MEITLFHKGCGGQVYKSNVDGTYHCLHCGKEVKVADLTSKETWKTF